MLKYYNYIVQTKVYQILIIRRKIIILRKNILKYMYYIWLILDITKLLL